MDRPVVFDQYDRLARSAGHRAVKSIDLLEMRHEVAAALGRTGMHNQFMRNMIKRAQHRQLLGLAWCRHAQIGAGFRPCSGEVGMRQRLALIAIKQNDVAGCGLLFAQLQTQANPIDLAGNLPPFQRVPRPPVTELFFRNALDNCDRLMRTPSRASISARMRAIVQFGRLATGSSSNGVTTRKAVSLLIGGGPGATLAFNASMPVRLKSLRHSRTVSSRTPNASATRGLVQPDSVSRMARALSASPRSREPASAVRAERWSSLAETGDLPLMPQPFRIDAESESYTYPLVKLAESA